MNNFGWNTKQQSSTLTNAIAKQEAPPVDVDGPRFSSNGAIRQATWNPSTQTTTAAQARRHLSTLTNAVSHSRRHASARNAQNVDETSKPYFVGDHLRGGRLDGARERRSLTCTFACVRCNGGNPEDRQLPVALASRDPQTRLHALAASPCLVQGPALACTNDVPLEVSARLCPWRWRPSLRRQSETSTSKQVPPRLMGQKDSAARPPHRRQSLVGSTTHIRQTEVCEKGTCKKAMVFRRCAVETTIY